MDRSSKNSYRCGSRCRPCVSLAPTRAIVGRFRRCLCDRAADELEEDLDGVEQGGAARADVLDAPADPVATEVRVSAQLDHERPVCRQRLPGPAVGRHRALLRLRFTIDDDADGTEITG